MVEIFDIMSCYVVNGNSKAIFEVENIMTNPILTTYADEYINKIKRKMKFLKNACLTIVLICALDKVMCVAVSTTRKHLMNDAEPPCNFDNDFCFLTFFIIDSMCLLNSAMGFIVAECIFFKWAMTCNCLLEVLQLNLRNIDYEKNGSSCKDELKLNIMRHNEILK